jgi:hypothetical protein
MNKKANEKWRMCVDYTNINKVRPKDSFSLLRINLLVDSTVGHELLSIMEACLGYNQIRMNEPKRRCPTLMGLYCYKVMPFELKNAGAT